MNCPVNLAIDCGIRFAENVDVEGANKALWLEVLFDRNPAALNQQAAKAAPRWNFNFRATTFLPCHVQAVRHHITIQMP